MINILNNQKLRITIDFIPENMKNIVNVKIANNTKQFLLTILYMYVFLFHSNLNDPVFSTTTLGWSETQRHFACSSTSLPLKIQNCENIISFRGDFNCLKKKWWDGWMAGISDGSLIIPEIWFLGVSGISWKMGSLKMDIMGPWTRHFGPNLLL